MPTMNTHALTAARRLGPASKADATSDEHRPHADGIRPPTLPLAPPPRRGQEEADPTWIDLGNRLPTEPPAVPPYDVQVIEAYQRSATTLAMETTHLATVTVQRARYECGHRRVAVVAHSLDRPRDDRALARVVVALHAWQGGCQCYRADWETYFTEPINRETLEEARRFAHEFVGEHPARWVHYAVRRVAQPIWDTDLDGVPW